MVHSELTDIPGIGERTAQKLLRRFGSVARVRAASEVELARIVTKPQAARIVEHFQEGK
jgi:excinuclease ABC subunit C